MIKLEEKFNNYYTKLEEEFEDSIWYHISPNNFDKFMPNAEGIHLADSIDGAKAVMENRNKKEGILYTVRITKDLNPLYIDLDTMRWTGPEAAKVLIAKINNTNLEGASGADIETEDGIGNYKYDLSPDLIHIDNLTSDDLDKLNEIANDKADAVSFFRFWQFINSKGYDAINYELAEDKHQNTRALIIWDPNIIQIISKEKITL